MLISANMQSLALLSHANDSLAPDKKSACLLREKFPKMTVRDIALVLNCSKSSVSNWLKEEKLLSSNEEDEIDSKDDGK
jgi:DNA-binding transcriptional regulator YiaG